MSPEFVPAKALLLAANPWDSRTGSSEGDLPEPLKQAFILCHP